MTFSKCILAVALSAAFSMAAHAAVTAEEAKQLGTTLTLVGAEKAGNADQSIPAYTGGLTTPPAAYKSGSGIRPDPYSNEKPLISITSKNMAQYKDKLTVATQQLLERYPDSYRVDLYPTHRSVALPKFVTDNTFKNATGASTTDEGVGLKGAHAGYPFPIPKTGNEVMWNHLLRYVGQAYISKFDSVVVDSAGKATLSTTGEITQEYPIYDPKKTGEIAATDTYFRLKIQYLGPARRAGEGVLTVDSVNPSVKPRRAWQYLPGQRRVKLAPDISYDTPNPGNAGMSTYDDSWIFNGALDRYDFKLVGKKEMIVPYNDYRMLYETKGEDVTKPNHLNPDVVRWELHRVWVVEATLKPGKRHIYAKRVFYVDEDSWVALASDQYDARGKLYRGGFSFITAAYEMPAPSADANATYDLISGSYAMTGVNLGSYYGVKFIEPLTEYDWSPDALAGQGIR